LFFGGGTKSPERDKEKKSWVKSRETVKVVKKKGESTLLGGGSMTKKKKERGMEKQLLTPDEKRRRRRRSLVRESPTGVFGKG